MLVDYSSIIEFNLNRFLSNAALEPLLHDSVSYSLMNAGKRIRPYMCLLITDMLGGSIENAIPYACAVEMIHTYSLIHDDLPAMDNDNIRRGKPSNHIVFGEGNAILAGDALLTLATDILSNESNLNAARAVSYGAISMLNGQSLDINTSKRDDDTIEKLYDGKTGGLFYAAILSAYFVSGGTNEGAIEWKRFAHNFGMLFQITDDILDREKDEQEGKFTYLSIHPLEDAKSYISALVKSLLSHLAEYNNEPADILRKLIQSLPLRTK